MLGYNYAKYLVGVALEIVIEKKLRMKVQREKQKKKMAIKTG